MIEAAFDRDVLNVISSNHSEFQYTRRCKAPWPQLLLNMEGACVYIDLPDIEEDYKDPTDFLQAYLHSNEFRSTRRNKVATSPKTIYGHMAIELVKIQDLFEKGYMVEALSLWDEARIRLPKFLRVELYHYGLD